jgi:hypothetical protein
MDFLLLVVQGRAQSKECPGPERACGFTFLHALRPVDSEICQKFPKSGDGTDDFYFSACLFSSRFSYSEGRM